MKTFKSLGLSISMMMASLLSLNMGVAARPSQSEGTPIKATVSWKGRG